MLQIEGAEFISYDEAARMCGCGRTKLQAAVSAGRIASVRPGRTKLLRRADVQEWLAAQISGGARRPGRPRRSR